MCAFHFHRINWCKGIINHYPGAAYWIRIIHQHHISFNLRWTAKMQGWEFHILIKFRVADQIQGNSIFIHIFAFPWHIAADLTATDLQIHILMSDHLPTAIIITTRIPQTGADTSSHTGCHIPCDLAADHLQCIYHFCTLRKNATACKRLVIADPCGSQLNAAIKGMNTAAHAASRTHHFSIFIIFYLWFSLISLYGTLAQQGSPIT